jgi:tRNA (mo5U34)-methyltransferase
MSGIADLQPIAPVLEAQHIVLAPAGSGTQYFLEYVRDREPGLKDRIVGIVDRDPAKAGTEMEGIPVVHSDSVEELAPEMVLVTSNVFRGELLDEFRERGDGKWTVVDVDTLQEYVAYHARVSRLYTDWRPERSAEEIEEHLALFPNWYHQMPVGHERFLRGSKGVLTTRMVSMIQMPEDLTGKRVLDVGALDGYYAFEAAARGAEDVLCVESYTWESGDGRARFDAAAELYGLPVRGKTASLESLDALDETFDLTLCLGLFYHLKDPYLGMRILAERTTETAIVSGHVVELDIQRPPRFPEGQVPFMLFYPEENWTGKASATNRWGPNLESMKQILLSSGFRRVEVVHYDIPPGGWHGSAVLQAHK